MILPFGERLFKIIGTQEIEDGLRSSYAFLSCLKVLSP